MPQLDISTYPSQIFWALVCFFALFIIAKLYIVPKIESIKDRRWEMQDNDDQRSQEMFDERLKLEEQAQTILEKAKQESDEILAKTEAELKHKLQKAIEEESKNLKDSFQQGQKVIDDKIETLEGDLFTISEEISDCIKGKIKNVF